MFTMLNHFEIKKLKRLKKTTYMGPLMDEKTKEYAPKKKNIIKSGEKQILNYGDTNILSESLKQSKLSTAFANILPDEQDTLNSLIFYKIIQGEANKDAKIWYDGNYAKILFPDANLESQRLSELLSKLGKESVQRKFFSHYICKIADISGEVVIDSTGMENEIEIPLTEYGGRNVQKETKLIMVIDRQTHKPLYFRLVAGNIADVSTLTTTFSLMCKFGASPQMVLMDAGYYSEKNIRALFKDNVSFLTRLPAGKKLYRRMIEHTAPTLENPQNIVVYNKRSLYIKKVKTDVCGYVGYAYVCCDIKQKGRKMDKFIQDAMGDNFTNEEIAEKIPFIGKFILVSDKEINTSELLSIYYTRQLAESTFGFSKNCLNLLPLRVHSIENLRGYMFLCYLALLLSLEIQNKLTGLCSLHDSLDLGHNQFCEIFGNQVIPLEPNKRLKEIYERLGVVVVNNSGE